MEWAAGVKDGRAQLPPRGLVQQKTKLLHSLRANLRLRHFSPRTEEAYVSWVRRFVRFHGLRHPGESGEGEVVAFLTHLSVERRVAASTQAQALAARDTDPSCPIALIPRRLPFCG